MHKGILAFADAEMQGIHIDVDYIQKKKVALDRKKIRLENKFKETSFYREWEKSQSGKVNIYSGEQLGNFLYNVKKIKPLKLTSGGKKGENKKGSTDEEALKKLDIPELSFYEEYKKVKKSLDVLSGFEREQVDEYMHTFFNLHLARTYRSCISKGTPILAVRDFLKYPNGIPIEEIKEGDYVYCFDNNLNPAIQKVLWAGKTGHREVIRIHYSVTGSHKSFIDVTPEHKIRLIDGSYVQAQNLVGDFRSETDDYHLPKIRTLSCKRRGDALNFTGHLTNGTGILEHRFIYSQLIGKLLEEELVHHKNEIHLDHIPSNLEKMSSSKHALYHVKNTLLTKKSRENNKQAIQKAKEAGVYKNCHPKGKDSPNYLGLSKFTCLRLLCEKKGEYSKVNYDFDTFKKYLRLHEIDPKIIKLRFDLNGKYIWKSYLQKISILGRAKVEKLLGGYNYYHLLKLYELYGINPKRKWANHIITKIEWIKKTVDVYDIEVEKYHNFFANEICVHNSSNSPNFQNIPIRDEEMQEICRSAIIPRPGHQLLEGDYGQLEVRISACYNNDKKLIHDILHGDMHSDMAKEIFKLDSIDKKIPGQAILRQAAKNGFIFPEFYGDYYKNCSENIADWAKLPQGKWKSGQGIIIDELGKPFKPYYISDHLISKGIKEFGEIKKVDGRTIVTGFIKHIQDIENKFWNKRYYEYKQWKDNFYEEYLKKGYIDSKTGFRFSGVMSFNDVVNYPIQGAAFHCLLWSFIEMSKFIKENNLDSKLIGQIHDSILIDTHPDELEIIAKKLIEITTVKLLEEWKWIILPLEIDIAVCGVDEPWLKKEKYKLNN
jgi:hypothetical protein